MKRGFILCALATALFACGDDEDGGSAGSGGSDGASGSGGSSASGSGGTAGSSAGAGGSGGRGGGFQTQMCPAEEPALGSTCTPARGDCMFGERICDCSNDSMTWACWNPADCPTTLPAEQSACDVVGMECDYGQGDSCECAATGWDCGNQFCPAAEPAAGSACEGGDGVCTFGARVCDCDSDIWACWNMTDCPATPPAEESVCPLEGMICPYEGGECECDGPDGWDCDRGVMNEDPDADAGV